jgi:hypothetical protein
MLPQLQMNFRNNYGKKTSYKKKEDKKPMEARNMGILATLIAKVVPLPLNLVFCIFKLRK